MNIFNAHCVFFSLKTMKQNITRKLSFFYTCDKFLGTWGIGLATRTEDLEKLPLGQSEKSWVLRSDSTTCHNGEIYTTLEVTFEEGDVIVCRHIR